MSPPAGSRLIATWHARERERLWAKDAKKPTIDDTQTKGNLG